MILILPERPLYFIKRVFDCQHNTKQKFTIHSINAVNVFTSDTQLMSIKKVVEKFLVLLDLQDEFEQVVMTNTIYIDIKGFKQLKTIKVANGT